MKNTLIVLALIAGSISLTARANPSPYPLAGTWQVTLTGGDLQSMAYEPQQNFLWEFELLAGGGYDIHIYAYGFDGKPFRIMSQSLNSETPHTGSLLLRTVFTNAAGMITQTDYEVRFDFNSKTVQGRYAKIVALGGMGAFPFTSRYYGWVSGRRLTPERLTLPKPVPKTPDAYKEEKEESEEYKACSKCVEEKKRACTKARNINQTEKQRIYWNTICTQDCQTCEGQGC